MKAIFGFLLCLALLVGCGKVPQRVNIPSYITADASDIRTILTNNAPPFASTVLTDAEYVIPTEEWVSGSFTKSFEKFLFDYNVRQYVEGRNECDKFSLYGRAVANAMNRHNPAGKGAGIAVGEVYMLTGVQGHAINFMVVADADKKLRLIFFEPQVMKIVTLTNYDPIILGWHM